MYIQKSINGVISILEMENRVNLKEIFSRDILNRVERDMITLIEARMDNDSITYDMIFGILILEITKFKGIQINKIDTSREYFHQFLNGYYYNKDYKGRTILTENEKLFSMGIQYALDNYMPGKLYSADCCRNCEEYIKWEAQNK